MADTATGTVPPAVHYVGDGAETRFPFSFTAFAPADIAVFLDGAPVASGYAASLSDSGGAIVFDKAPAEGTAITLRRRLALATPVDFPQGGSLSAAALNHGFAYLTAAARDQQARFARALHYPDGEPAPSATLPPAARRRGQLLRFDSSGAPGLQDPDALDGTTDSPTSSVDVTYSAHSQAQDRSVEARLRERISVRDFGALGDGSTDDTDAFRSALANAQAVYVPAGDYRLSGTLDLGYGQRLEGQGESSRLIADATDYPLLALRDSYIAVGGLRLEGGGPALRLRGDDGPCVGASLTDLAIWDSAIGMLLDGYDSSSRPCYWNFAARVLIAKPATAGVRLQLSAGGNPPAANRFQQVRVYSLGVATSGPGIDVQQGQSLNTFTDCEVTGADTMPACVRLGDGSTETVLVNLYTETGAAVDNLALSSGSQASRIVNLGAYSGGAAIADSSGGSYEALNAGYPRRAKLGEAYTPKLETDRLLPGRVVFDTAFDEQSGTYSVSLATRFHLVSAYNGARDAELPNAGDANGETVTIKKSDTSSNAVTVVEANGPGPDGGSATLASQYDALTCFSNGANWWIVARHP